MYVYSNVWESYLTEHYGTVVGNRMGIFRGGTSRRIDGATPPHTHKLKTKKTLCSTLSRTNFRTCAVPEENKKNEATINTAVMRSNILLKTRLCKSFWWHIYIVRSTAA